MSATAPPEVLVSRGQGLEDLKAVLAAVRRDEQSRKWWATMAAFLPWSVAGMATLFALSAGLLVWSRPVPKDHFMIAVMHGDGSYDPPIERDDLPVSKKQILLDYTVIRFALAYESYAWRANQGNYRFVSAVTAGEELRGQYQMRFAEGKPGNLDEKYGPDVTRDVAAIQVIPIPSAPYARDVQMLIKMRKGGEATCQRWRARLTFKDDTTGLIPLPIQKEFDPLDIIFVSYESTIDPTVSGISGCGA